MLLVPGVVFPSLSGDANGEESETHREKRGKKLSAKERVRCEVAGTRNLGSRRADAVKGGVAKKTTWK